MKLNRRQFIGLGLSSAAAAVLAACSQGEETQPVAPVTMGAPEVVRQDAVASSDNEIVAAFAMPDASYRPLTRWWVPGSMMDAAEVTHEIESMAEAGFGGAEVVPVSIAGGDDSAGTIDWGSDRWKEITKHMLEVAGDNDFTIDFTMTPAWPLALPGIDDVDDPAQGAQMELDGAHVIVKGKAGKELVVELPESQESIDDAAAVNGTVELVAVTLARITDDKPDDADNVEGVISYDSALALDLDTVDEADGKRSVAFTPDEDGSYLVYAFYQHPAGNMKYGNTQLDHFSRAAADALTTYWDENLIPYYGDAWANVRSLFIDSLEFETEADWTYGILDEFRDRFGYDLTPYLPAIYDEGLPWDDMGATGNYMGEPIPTFAFDKNARKILNDWRECLTQLYIENHIQPLAAWAQSQGVTLRYQTSYGKDLETAHSALFPDVPETESLYGNDNMDFYRLQAGAVHAMDRPIYSMETSAEWTETWNPKNDEGEYGTRGNGEKNSGNYEQTFLAHLWHDQRAFATGVNQVVFHGYPYSGAYEGGAVEGTQWPGFTGFESYRWCNSWGERQPNWMFSPTYLDYVTRSQYVLRQGMPKVDVAIYRHSYYEIIDFWRPEKIFRTEALEQAGYSYDFVCPATLELDDMAVTDGALDVDGAAYKALVVGEGEPLNAEVVSRLTEYAKDGLPVIFVGKPAADGSSMADDNIEAALDALVSMPGVTVVKDADEVLAALQVGGVTPDASYDAQTLLANHRQEDGRDWYYLYNYANTNAYWEIHDAKAVEADVTLQGSGTPYLFDAWTGKVSPFADFEAKDGSVTLNVSIAPNDTCIVVLSEEDLVPASDPADVMASEVKVKDWSLAVESWTPGDTVLETKREVIEVGKLDKLVTWDQIEGLADVSGVGTYSASFELGGGYVEGQRAYVHLGHVKDAFGVKVNGEWAVADQASAIAEVTDLVKAGSNDIEIVVATSLLNAVLLNNADILNEEGRVLDDRSRSAYGLYHDVVINGSAC